MYKISYLGIEKDSDVVHRSCYQAARSAAFAGMTASKLYGSAAYDLYFKSLVCLLAFCKRYTIHTGRNMSRFFVRLALAAELMLFALHCQVYMRKGFNLNPVVLGPTFWARALANLVAKINALYVLKQHWP